jgi:retron-type reverse transcriptase
MRRVGNLWPRLVSLENLFEAAHKAALGKRSRPDVSRFLMSLEPEVHRLRRELLEGSYHPGTYRTFTIHEPKPRRISAAPFRDRVVHHALTQVIEPVFERRFTADSYACRTGFGSHRALQAAQRAARVYPYVLKCDVRKYFPSIDFEILKSQLREAIKCQPTLQLADLIIDGSNPQEEAAAYFPGDDLFSPYERRRGLPLGNQTSQFFANVYLNPLDHFVKRVLKTDTYIRYVDDFLLFGHEKVELNMARREVEGFLAGLRLRIHPGKSRVYAVRDGVSFLGWRIFPDRSRLARANVTRFKRRLRRLQEDFADGRIELAGIRARVIAWIAHAAHGDTWRLRWSLFQNHPFPR